MAAALVFRATLDARDKHVLIHRDHETTNEDQLLDVIRDEANAVLEARGRDTAQRFFNVATGKATFIEETYQPWLDQWEGAGQTKHQHTTAIKRYMVWAGAAATVEETTRKKAGEYINDLIATFGLTRRTIERHASSLSSLWPFAPASRRVLVPQPDTPVCPPLFARRRHCTSCDMRGYLHLISSRANLLKLFDLIPCA